MGKAAEYKARNEAFLAEKRGQEGVHELPGGVLYRVLETGEGTVSPNLNSVVTVHYRGVLVGGKEFDNSWKRTCPEAFRLKDVIEGWQIALQQMHVGDKWIVYIPQEKGYGRRACGSIPGASTLIFEIKLLSIV